MQVESGSDGKKMGQITIYLLFKWSIKWGHHLRLEQGNQYWKFEKKKRFDSSPKRGCHPRSIAVLLGSAEGPLKICSYKSEWLKWS